MLRPAWGAALLALAACGPTYRSDLAFLKGRVETLVLGERDRDARVLVCPSLRGSVMSSAAAGDGSRAYGWIPYDELEAPFGGEDRLLVGPEEREAGAYAFDVLSAGPELVKMRKDLRLRDGSGFVFALALERDVRLLREERAWRLLQMAPEPGLLMVAYETLNQVRNLGAEAWTAERNFVVRALGSLPATPRSVIVLPTRDGPGPAFEGDAPPDRVYTRPGMVFFRADGLHPSRVELRPSRMRPTLGCWSPERGVLTLIQHTGVASAVRNDGPGFFELELASAPLALPPGKSATFLRRTIHLQGPRAGLDEVARRQLGAGLDEIEAAPLR